MRTTRKLFSVALSALLIAGCGSDDDDDPPPPAPAPAPAPTPAPAPVTATSAPTAVLAAKDANAARSLVIEVQKAASESVQVGTVPMPGSGQTLPGGGAVTYNCSQFFGAGATGTVSYSFPDTPPAAGWKATFTFNNCTYTGNGNTYTANGSVSYEYLRYTSGSDFAFRATAENLVYTYSYNGVVLQAGSYNFSFAYELKNGVISTSYTTASGAVLASLQVARSGTNATLNATYVTNSPAFGGIVKVEFTNWTYDVTTGRPVSGSARVTGANGTRVDIVASSTGYVVTYTASGGTTTSFSVPY